MSVFSNIYARVLYSVLKTKLKSIFNKYGVALDDDFFDRVIKFQVSDKGAEVEILLPYFEQGYYGVFNECQVPRSEIKDEFIELGIDDDEIVDKYIEMLVNGEFIGFFDSVEKDVMSFFKMF